MDVWILILFIVFLIITLFYSTENKINRSSSFVEQRIVSAVKGGDVSINRRILYMHVVHEMFKDRPFFGLGIGLYKMNYLYYQAEVINNLPKFHQYSANAQEAHNEYLQLLAEVGIIGLIIFLAIFFFFYIQIIYFLLHKNISEKDKAIIFGLLMSITGFLIHSLFTFPLHVPALGMTFFGILGINVSYINIIGQNNLNDLEKAFKGNNHNNNHSKNIHNIFSNQYFVFLTIIITIIVTIYLLTFLVFNPYYAELEYFSGLRHTADKNYPAALNKFEKAYQLNPYDGKNLHALGGTYYNLKKYVNAEYYLKKAKHYITDTNTFYNLGLTYKETNQLQLAKKEFETVIRLAPDYLEAYYELGLLYFIADKYLEAIGKWGKILEIDPSFENKYIVKYNIGLTYIKMDNDLEAVKYFREALKEAPEDSPVMDDIEKELLNINKNQKLEK